VQAGVFFSKVKFPGKCMHKTTLIFFLISLIGLNVFAQKSQALKDFSGTWIIDEKSSFQFSVDKENFEDFTLVISQNEPEIKITQTYSFKGKPSEQTIKLFTDKRGEENKYAIERFSRYPNIEDYSLDDVNLRSKTYLKKDKIIREGTYKAEVNTYPIVIKQTYSLSSDGRTLTIITEKTVVTTIASSSSVLDSKSERDSTSLYPKPASSSTGRLIFHKKE